jgi:2-iminobutanoate/2-iminopropanoate deaminase
MAVKVFNPSTVHDTGEKGYSHAARMGDLIFLAGQVALDRDGNIVGKGDIEAQCEQIFRNMDSVLVAAGSSLSKVGKLTTYITDEAYILPSRKVRNRIFGEAGIRPPNTLLIISGLADPDFLIEIEAVASVA